MDYKKLELSTQILIKEALNRGIKVDVLDWDDNFIRLSKGEKTEYVKQATKTSADTYIAPLIMENKEVTKIILKEHGLRVPEGFTVHSVEEGLKIADSFKGKSIVIKPKSTNFGKGVQILGENATVKEYKFSLEYAFGYDSSVLIEEFISGKEYRFLVIGNEVAGILHRVPANVTGDGTHSIAELVTEKNKDPLRGKGYVTPLEKIDLRVTEREYLSQHGKSIGYVPEKGETVYLRENSNISTGGDSLDFTDEIREEYKAIAVQASKAAGAKICGADIIIKDITAAPDNNNYGIIELNFNPAIHIHDYPYMGLNRKVEDKVLSLLGF